MNDIIPKKFAFMETQFTESDKTKISSPKEIIFKNPEFTNGKIKFTGILVANSRVKKNDPYYMNIGKFIVPFEEEIGG